MNQAFTVIEYDSLFICFLVERLDTLPAHEFLAALTLDYYSCFTVLDKDYCGSRQAVIVTRHAERVCSGVIERDNISYLQQKYSLQRKFRDTVRV